MMPAKFVTNEQANRQIEIIDSLVRRGETDLEIAAILAARGETNLKSGTPLWDESDVCEIRCSFRLGTGNSQGAFASRCMKCSNPLSPSAKKCPKCHYPTPMNTAVCRICGTPLARDLHRRVFETSYLVDGTTKHGLGVRHAPCPNCGEPLRQSTDPFLPYFPLLLLLALILPVGLWVYYDINKESRNQNEISFSGILQKEMCKELPGQIAQLVNALTPADVQVGKFDIISFNNRLNGSNRGAASSLDYAASHLVAEFSATGTNEFNLHLAVPEYRPPKVPDAQGITQNAPSEFDLKLKVKRETVEPIGITLKTYEYSQITGKPVLMKPLSLPGDTGYLNLKNLKSWLDFGFRGVLAWGCGYDPTVRRPSEASP